ncbi:MAG TPA: hypothetical protein VGM23_18660, partial [Armatimonadota bacterium]
PDPRFGTRLVPAFGNGSWEMAPLFGWLANLTKDDDPTFSRQMQWMWIEQGKPDWMQYSETILDPDLPAEQPTLVSKNYPGFGTILRNGFPAKDESWIAFRIGDNIEHYNHGDQGSFMYFAKGAPLVLQFGSQYQPYYRGAWYFNRVSIGHQEVQPGLFGGTEYASGSGDPEYPGKVIDFGRLQAADYAVGQHVSSKQSLLPDDCRVPMPPNTEGIGHDISRHLWTRQMVLMKSFTPAGAEDPSGPNYLVMKDTIASEKPLPSEWNLWLLADTLDTNGNTASAKSPFGVQLDIFMVDPAQPKWFTREDSHTFLAGPSVEYWRKMNNNKPWKETLKNLRASQTPGGGFFAVLYPRKDGEQPAQFQPLANGQGVSIMHPRGLDSVFVGLQPVNWNAGDRKFTGTSGAIRQEGDTLSLILLAPGEISAKGYTLKAPAPASLILRNGALTVVTKEAGQAIQITLPGGKQVQGVGSPTGQKVS